MKCACKATTRILSIILVFTFMLTAVPTSVFAAIGEPFNDADGNSREYFDGFVEDESSEPLNSEASPISAAPDDNYHNSGPSNENGTAAFTSDSLGESGIALDLPADVLADFIAFMENAEKAIENPQFSLFAGVGDTGTISWSWGETANFNAGGYYCSQIPRLSLSTTRPSEGRPFCAQFGPDPLTGGTYRASAYTHPTILKLMVAFNEGKASAVGVQLAIWSITNNASAFATHPEAQAALSAANSVNTDGYTLLRWTASGSYQPFFTLEKDTIPPSEWTLKIIKKSTDRKSVV